MLCKDGGLNEKLGVYIHNGMETIQFKTNKYKLLPGYTKYLFFKKYPNNLMSVIKQWTKSSGRAV